MVVAQGMETKISQVSHVSGSKNNLAVSLWEMLKLELLHYSLLLCRHFRPHPFPEQLEGGDAGSLHMRATAAIIKQRGTFLFFCN